MTVLKTINDVYSHTTICMLQLEKLGILVNLRNHLILIFTFDISDEDPITNENHNHN